jgi:hypothetical protein
MKPGGTDEEKKENMAHVQRMLMQFVARRVSVR